MNDCCCSHNWGSRGAYEQVPVTLRGKKNCPCRMDRINPHRLEIYKPYPPHRSSTVNRCLNSRLGMTAILWHLLRAILASSTLHFHSKSLPPKRTFYLKIRIPFTRKFYPSTKNSLFNIQTNKITVSYIPVIK